MLKSETVKALNAATGTQIGHLAHDAAAWFQAFYLQTDRLFCHGDCENDCFKIPWNKGDRFQPVVERHFWVTTLYHTLESIEALNVALIAHGDNRLQTLKTAILDADRFQEMRRKLRNETEHYIEYFIGEGRKQNEFETMITTPMGEMRTDSHWLVQVEDKCFIGDVDCLETIKHMMKYRDELVPCLEKIMIDYWEKENNGQDAHGNP